MVTIKTKYVISTIIFYVLCITAKLTFCRQEHMPLSQHSNENATENLPFVTSIAPIKCLGI